MSSRLFSLSLCLALAWSPAAAAEDLVVITVEGIDKPGIIAAESPNPIVSDLIIMPDIEKRLEAFVRLGHDDLADLDGDGTADGQTREPHGQASRCTTE